MPVSGLVVSFCGEPQSLAETLAAIGLETRITMGVCEDNRLAIVTDTVSNEEDYQLWEWLRSLAGVTGVEVAFVSLEQRVESLPVPSGGCQIQHDEFPTQGRISTAEKRNMQNGLHHGC